MAMSERGTGTSNPLRDEYQVFLSFSRPDVRRGFIETLFHDLTDAGIHVFIDDKEFRLGERISSNLLQAIDVSRLYIPIFSTNYALSHWCHRKLAKMVENTSKYGEDGNKKVILPIFYNVEPNDVMRKTRLYGNAISKLEKSIEEVDKWPYALGKVDGTKRWEVEKYSSDGDLIKSVFKEVVNRLQRRQREVTDHLVGMDGPIADIENLLDIQSSGVRVIGIVGLGGVGKTTLAKMIFHKLCPLFGDNCSFLGDISETAITKGLVMLQERLLFDISNPRVASEIREIGDGINRIRDTICNKKVLIVLDDVDDSNQIQNLVGVNSLYLGTRILVTTRNSRVLKIKGFEYKTECYIMMPLAERHACQLFSRHAFNFNSPPDNYYTISRSIVSNTSGLPLALKVIGSSLSNLSETALWKEMLGKLRHAPYGNSLAILRPAYDTLDMEEQHIFLDIACFFIGHNKIGPISLWKDSGFRTEYAIDVLINRRMIEVLGDNSFWMHDVLSSLGKAIAKQEHTRLWERDDIICELRSTEIMGSVRALCLRAEVGNPVTVTAEQIKRFPHLQFLWLSNVICRGDLTGCLSELKWISLHYSHTPKYYQGFEATNLPVENVVVMELSGAEFTIDKFRSLIRGAGKLKVFTVHCDAPVKIMSRI